MRQLSQVSGSPFRFKRMNSATWRMLRACAAEESSLSARDVTAQSDIRLAFLLQACGDQSLTAVYQKKLLQCLGGAGGGERDT